LIIIEDQFKFWEKNLVAISCSGYVSKLSSIQEDRLFEILDDLISKKGEEESQPLLCKFFGIDEKLAERLMKYYKERKENQDLLKTNYNPRLRIEPSHIIKQVFNHFTLIPEPLMYIPGFHHSPINEDNVRVGVIYSEIFLSFEALNQICLDPRTKSLSNIPNEIIQFNYDQGIKIRGFSSCGLLWNKRNREFIIRRVDIPDLSVSEQHQDFQEIYDTLTNFISDRKMIDEKVQQWINTLNLAFRFEIRNDYDHGVVNIDINERTVDYNKDVDKLIEIFQVYHSLNSSSQEFKFENGWKCKFSIGVHILDDNTRLFIEFLTTIPQQFDYREEFLYQGKIQDILKLLNSNWMNHSHIKFGWNEENFKKYLYGLCKNHRERVYDILLARILENEVF
jgi:hypothetical protein